MRTLAITVAVLGTATSFALAQGTASPAGAAQQPQQQQQQAEHKPCGQMLSDNARYPDQLATVVTSVADMMDAHAKWAGTGSKEAKAEHDRILKLSKMHRELAAQAKKMSAAMRESRNLADFPHDMKAVPPALTQAMERYETEARRFAQMLNQGADENMKMRQAMMGGGMQRGTGGSGDMPSDPAMPDDEREPGTGGSGTQPFPQDTGTPYEPPPPGDEREPGLGGRPPPVDSTMPGQTPSSDRPDDSVPPTPEPPRP